ncbi:hypothetical protein FF38_03645 [Lucilia cuprina]|uniref:MD-2-related lipid-recognition domain-containing protein n=1 Tax=Lucilia cuprina TaxID=7375 RepID=A0A0L0CLA2_LUCCU|nr:hypothetical protein CVS40_0082 [Lucilia cuprina]KNC33143.1 hypothetical protein FF38_03645 [Lucilia cuprina]
MTKIIKVFMVLFYALNLIHNSMGKTPVRKCANGLPEPLSVQVNSCSEMPCTLWRGFSTNMEIQFVSTKDAVRDINADVQMTTAGIGMSLGLSSERKNVCNNLMFGAYCPMYAEEDATYHLVLDIADHQPEVPVKIEVSIKDSSDDTVFACFVLDGKIRRRNAPLM